jgi:hypothetical protein
MISSNNECTIILDLSDHTLQIIFNAWSASRNAGSKRHIEGNYSTHAPSLRFDLRCGIEVTGSPGIRGIFVTKFFAIHQTMGPAECGNTCWQNPISQSNTK